MTEKNYDIDDVANETNEQAKKQDTKVKVLLTLVSIAVLMVLLIAVLQENVFVSWRKHQNKYRDILQTKATDDWGKKLADEYKVQVAQIYIPELNISDRCISCHSGIDDPRMTDVPNPYRFHSGDHLKHHDPAKFGCTTCHSGQGRAIEKDDAHGEVDHWLYPRLTKEAVYSSCSRCHFENDLYGGQEDLYAADDTLRLLKREAIDAIIPGFDSSNSLSIVRGKKLVLSAGCLGCHEYRGRGGTLGPDISYTGDKTVHAFVFQHVNGPHTVPQWLFEHFKRPDLVSPDTLMPDMNLTDRQARDMTNYMLSLHRKTMLAKYTPAPKPIKDTPATGRQLYSMFCSGCHGTDGGGSTVRDPKTADAADVPAELMVPSLNNTDTLSVVSDQYLEAIIRNGRDNTNMIGWSAQKQGNLADQEIIELVKYIRLWQKPPADIGSIAAGRGSERDGSLIYKQNCASCHGRQGQGSIGPSLNSRGFLSVASDRFLGLTLIHGRPNTAMPSWRDLDTQRTNDVIAYMRSWQELKSQKDKVMELVASSRQNSNISAGIGKILYKSNCLTCHGQDGQGDLGPSISTQEFLTLIDDSYLYETLAHGREGTGMPAWRGFSNEDMASLIMYIDKWLGSPRKKLPPTRVNGDRDSGKILFAGMCASCHGDNAEGGLGPQLANHQFLNQANDSMLTVWIGHGKLGTAMQAFLKSKQGMVDLTEFQINNIVAYLRSLEYADLPKINKYFSGRPELGQEWFANFCASCHGPKGEGASGPSLANHQFLNAASSGYLMATMATGRDGTEMRPVKDGPQSILALDSDQINDVVAYLRSLEYGSAKDDIMHNFVIPWDLEHGRKLYRSNCSGCHGINGKAEKSQKGKLSAWAPELNNKQFLDSATDGFLQATIINGRQGTSMRPFGLYANGLADLTPDEVDDVVAYIRNWSNLPLQPMTIPAQRDTEKQTQNEN